MSRISRLGVALAFLTLASIAGVFTSPVFAKPFIFSAIPDDNEARLRERFDKVAAYIGKEMGVEVKYIPVKTYAASVSAFKNDQVQMAWFGGLSGLQARLAVPGSLAIAQGMEDKEFVSYFIANTSLGLKEAAQLPDAIKDKTFTFGAKDSTSGRLAPDYYLRERFKTVPEKIFSSVGFSGEHSKTIALVQSGAYDVGAVNFTVWDLDVKEGKVDQSKVAVIWKTPKFQDYNFSVRGDVDKNYGAGFTAKLTKVILDIKDPAILAAFPRKGFIPVKNSDYNGLQEVAQSIGLLDQ